MMRLPYLTVTVDQEGQLVGGCMAMKENAKGVCPHARYDDSILQIERLAREGAVGISDGFVVIDRDGRTLTGLTGERARGACEIELRPGGSAPVLMTLTRGADCPRSPSPNAGTEGVYSIIDPAVRASLGKFGFPEDA